MRARHERAGAAGGVLLVLTLGVVFAALPSSAPSVVADPSTVTPTVFATGTPSATATPVHQASLQLRPTSTPPGSTVLVDGAGFEPLEEVIVSYRAQTSYGQTVTVQMATSTTSNGSFAGAPLSVPPYIASGTYAVVATGQISGLTAAAQLVVVAGPGQPTLTPSPAPPPTASTPTAIPNVTATGTPESPTAVPTATSTATRSPAVNPYVLAIKYAYVWFRTVRLGTWNHVVVQANHRQRLGVQINVVFPSGRRLDYAGRTDRRGHWERTFGVPSNAWDRYSNGALVVVRLRHGLTTKRANVPFTVTR